MNENKSSSRGLGITGVLQVVFITLKVLNLIDWSWWMVFVPTFIDIGLIILIVLFVAFTGIQAGRRRTL